MSTYAPKLCGLATFAAALAKELTRAGNAVAVVRINDGDGAPPTDPIVVADLINGSASSVAATASVMSEYDLAIVQHEYGIFGGTDGDEILDLLKLLETPAVVVLHTVLTNPTSHQRAVLEAIGALSDRVVVMSDTALRRLRDLYTFDMTKVEMIPHGAWSIDSPCRIDTPARTRPELLTWGLLGPGKGIEHVVDALGLIGSDHYRPRYTVAGVTHPKVFARVGDAYRDSLIQRVGDLGLGHIVSFDDTYRGVGQLLSIVAQSTAVVLPYDSREQVTSGVLVDAVAAGKPVIATAFPHAVELLGSGAGIVVPHGDPVALAAAIRSTFDDPVQLAAMTREAARIAPSLSWATVARQYARLGDDLVRSRDTLAV
ncbi:MAG: glycosyltransferase [Acidimicrobiia bacterium]